MNERSTFFVLFFAALVIRLLHCLIFANEVIPGSDQMQEIILGRKMASGDLYGVLDTYWAPFYPILIGIASIFVDSPVIPAMIVSLLASSLIVPLVYVFILQSYGQREAVIAGVIALFFPHLINSVVAMGSENVFVALMLGILIVSWRAFVTESMTLSFVAGLMLGLAYLTRPEAIGFIAYFAPVMIVLDLWRKRPFLKGSLPRAAVLLLGFALLAAPYIVYLHGETRRWMVSRKAEINTIAAEVESEPGTAELGASARATEFAKYFLYNFTEIQKMLPALFPLLLWLLVGLGLFSGVWEKERLEREIFLVLFCLVTIVGYAAAVVQLRYFYVLLPILIGWTAAGIVQFSNWLHDSASRNIGATSFFKPRTFAALATALIFVYLLPLNFYMRSSDRRWETSGYEERDAGLWLRRNGKPGPYVFSASRRPAFYAEARQMSPESQDTGTILSEIKQQRVDYVVTSDRSLKRNPYLNGFDDTLRNDPAFELVYNEKPRDGYQISIFRRIDKN